MRYAIILVGVLAALVAARQGSSGSLALRTGPGALDGQHEPELQSPLVFLGPLEDAGSDIDLITLSDTPFAVIGLVVDEQERPVPHAAVRMTPKLRRDRLRQQLAFTDTSGRFVFESPRTEGGLRLTPSRRGYCAPEGMSDASVDANVGDHDVVLRLVRFGRISGSLLLDPGIPADTVRIEAGAGNLLVIPFSDGTFEIPEMRPGELVVRVVTRRRTRHLKAQSNASSDALAASHNVRVEAGQISSIPIMDLRGLLARYDVVVTKTDGTALALASLMPTMQVVPPSTRHYTSYEGKAILIGLSSSLTVVASKRCYRDQTVELRPGQNRIALFR